MRVVLVPPLPTEFDPDAALAETIASASGEATLSFAIPAAPAQFRCFHVLLFDDEFQHKPGALLEVLTPRRGG